MAKLVPKSQSQKSFKAINIKPSSLEDVARVTSDMFRRLQNKVSEVQEVVQKDAGVSKVTPVVKPAQTIPQTTTWAARYQHNDTTVAGDDVQIVSFKDSPDIEFDIRQGSTQQPLKSGGVNAQKIIVGARIKDKKNTIYGMLYVNQLPLDPATMPSGTPTSQLYKYDGYYITPDHNYYGWYVYGIINHNFHLEHKDRYLLKMVDQHSFDLSGLDATEAIAYQSRFPNQTGRWTDEGLDNDKIIVRAMYRPDMIVGYGIQPEPVLDYIDEANRIIRTNIIMYYVVTKGK